MTKQSINTLLTAGFKPLPGAQTRIWNRLDTSAATARRGWKTPALRWALSAGLAVLILWGAAVWNRPEPQPMLARMSALASSSQRYGEAGPRGHEYVRQYIPFQ